MTRRKFSLGSLIALAVAPLLTLTSCGVTSVIEILQLAVDAAAAAIPLVAGALGLSPATIALLENYLQQVSTAISGAATILASGVTAAAEALQILQLFTGIVIPDLTGLPAAIVSAIQLVAKYVAQFLANFSTAKMAQLGAKAQQPVKISSTDHAKLVGIGGKAQANLAAIVKAKQGAKK